MGDGTMAKRKKLAPAKKLQKKTTLTTVLKDGSAGGNVT